MADQRGAGGVPLTGKAVFDEELYGGAEPITGFAAVAQDVDEEEVDEREAAVARCVMRQLVCSRGRACAAGLAPAVVGSVSA